MERPSEPERPTKRQKLDGELSGTNDKSSSVQDATSPSLSEDEEAEVENTDEAARGTDLYLDTVLFNFILCSTVTLTPYT